MYGQFFSGSGGWGVRGVVGSGYIESMGCRWRGYFRLCLLFSAVACGNVVSGPCGYSFCSYRSIICKDYIPSSRLCGGYIIAYNFGVLFRC